MAEPPLPPPVARKSPRVFVQHGDRRIDDYYWLREKSNPEVIAYLEAENRYNEAMMRHTEAFQRSLYDEMVARVKQTDDTVPEPLDQYLYYSRTEEGKQYRIHCRKEDHLEAREEVILDINELAAGHKYLNVGAIRISPDHKLLAYTEDTSGSEIFTLRIKDLETGKLLPDQVPNVYYSVEWTGDGKSIYYDTLDAAHRPYRVRRHDLGGDPASDPTVFTEPDELFNVSISKTRSREWLVIESDSKTTTEVRYKPAADADGEFRVMEPRRKGVKYHVEHQGEWFYIRTDDDNARNFQIVRTPVASPGRANWKPWIAHDRQVLIESVDGFENHVVVTRRVKGLIQLRVFEARAASSHDIDFPEPAYAVFVDSNPEYKTKKLRFRYLSLVTPSSVYDYDMDTKSRLLRKRTEVLGGYDPGNYQVERIAARASDGTEVPISLVYKKGVTRDGKSALLLAGYGSYGIPSDPTFNSDRFSLVDRGVIFAIAHIRGGGDISRYWYDDGKLLKKRNSFTDFVACAEHLVRQKYTASDRLAIYGGSAGGLLVGAVLNMRPDLFHAAVAKVPFVDVLNTMLDPTIPLTTQEYEEWGNPADKQYYEYMKSYSPYDNVARKTYPDLLITTGLNDPRVAYWEPAKWTARLRAMKTGSRPLLLKTEMGSGHGGSSGRYDRWKETAFDYAFLLDRLGVAG